MTTKKMGKETLVGLNSYEGEECVGECTRVMARLLGKEPGKDSVGLTTGDPEKVAAAMRVAATHVRNRFH